MTRIGFIRLLLLVFATFVLFPLNRNAHMQSSEEIVLLVDWSMDGSMLAVGFQDSRLEVFDVETGQSLVEHSVTGAITGLQWSPRTPSLLAVGITDALRATGSVEIIDTYTGQLRWSFDAGKPVSSITWSSDGARIAAAGNEMFDTPLDINEIKIWDLLTGDETGSIPQDYPTYINEVAWSPNGDRIAGGSSDGRIIVWDASTGAQVAEMTGHSSAILGVAWASDNLRMVSISFSPENTLRIWDSLTGSELRELEMDSPRGLDWNISNNDLVVREALAIRVLDAFTSQEKTRISDAGPHRGVSFSPFGGRLAYGGGVPSDASFQDSIGAVAPAYSLAQGLVQIVVPDPSPAGLEAVATACNAPPAVVSTLTAAAQAEQFESLSALVELLGVEELPPGCTADMQAVIEAMAAG